MTMKLPRVEAATSRSLIPRSSHYIATPTNWYATKSGTQRLKIKSEGLATYKSRNLGPVALYSFGRDSRIAEAK